MSRLAEALTPHEFGGSTFDPAKDGARLSKQLKSVLALMSDGAWRTPAQFEEALGVSWASLGARVRDLKKPQFGSWKIDRHAVGGGLYKYRLRVPG